MRPAREEEMPQEFPPERGGEEGDGAPSSPPAAFILVAEDDDEFRSLLGSALHADGHTVFLAKDGWELAGMLEPGVELKSPLRKPDLVITDIRMPGPSGLDALAMIRQRNRRVPVILITAFGDPETHARALRLGASKVFDKPFPMEELRLAVRNLLRPPGLR